DGLVFVSVARGVAPRSPSGQMVVATDDPRWREDGTMARGSRRVSRLYRVMRWNVQYAIRRGRMSDAMRLSTAWGARALQRWSTHIRMPVLLRCLEGLVTSAPGILYEPRWVLATLT